MIPAPLAAWAVTAAGKRVMFWAKVGAIVAAVALVAWAGNRVTVWHASHVRLQATEKALETSRAEAQQCLSREARARQVYAESQRKAAETAARDKATAERIERELQARNAASESRGRDLARRLQDSRICPGSVSVPAVADPAGQPATGPGEPAGADRVGEATAALISACERDSTRLAGWQEWWAGVSR